MNLVERAIQNGIGAKLPLPYFQQSKDALVDVKDYDSDQIHIAWAIGKGRVLSFEHIPENYPSTSYSINDTVEEYKQSIWNVEWIQRELDYDSDFKNSEFISDPEHDVVDMDEYDGSNEDVLEQIREAANLRPF